MKRPSEKERFEEFTLSFQFGIVSNGPSFQCNNLSFYGMALLFSRVAVEASNPDEENHNANVVKVAYSNMHVRTANMVEASRPLAALVRCPTVFFYGLTITVHCRVPQQALGVSDGQLLIHFSHHSQLEVPLSPLVLPFVAVIVFCLPSVLRIFHSHARNVFCIHDGSFSSRSSTSACHCVAVPSCPPFQAAEIRVAAPAAVA